jgi:Domain of unknown function (DUF4177)
MKTPFNLNLKSLVLGAALGAMIVFSVAATNSGSHALWDYKVVSGRIYQNELEKAINNAAADGWELVSASSSVETYAFAVMRRERR